MTWTLNARQYVLLTVLPTRLRGAPVSTSLNIVTVSINSVGSWPDPTYTFTSPVRLSLPPSVYHPYILSSLLYQVTPSGPSATSLCLHGSRSLTHTHAHAHNLLLPLGLTVFITIWPWDLCVLMIFSPSQHKHTYWQTVSLVWIMLFLPLLKDIGVRNDGFQTTAMVPFLERRREKQLVIRCFFWQLLFRTVSSCLLINLVQLRFWENPLINPLIH